MAEGASLPVAQFERSGAKLWAFALALGVFTALGALIATTLYANSGVFWPWTIPAILAVLLVLSLRSALCLPDVVYRVTPSGITLCGISEQEISWRHVKSVSVMTLKGTRVIVLRFVPDFGLKRLGFIRQKSITLSSGIVRSRFDELLRAIREAHSNFHEGADPDPGKP